MKPDYKNDPFFQFPRVNRKTSKGNVEFPIYYYDVSNLIAVFKADVQGVETILKDSGMESALTIGGKPLVFMSFYEYRNTSIGSYNEVGVAIPVLRKEMGKGMKPPINNFVDLMRAVDKRQVGFYVVDLPVTTEEANAAGRELWGYPKFVTDIPFKLGASAFNSEVKDPQFGSIAHLRGKLNLGIKAPTLSAVTYSHLGSKTLRATVNVRGNYKAYFAHDLKLNVGSSQHVMANNLRTLGLNNARPLAVMGSTDFQSRLNLGAEI